MCETTLRRGILYHCSRTTVHDVSRFMNCTATSLFHFLALPIFQYIAQQIIIHVAVVQICPKFSANIEST